MKILYVTPRHLSRTGGVEYVVRSLVVRLANMGYKITVLTGESKIYKYKFEKYNNIIDVISWPTYSFQNSYHIPKYKKEFERFLGKLASTHQVVHIHSAHAVLPILTGIKLKKLNSNIKLIFTPHYHGTAHTFFRRILWDLYWKRKINTIINLSDKIQAVSKYEARLLQSHYPTAKTKITVIPNGVDEDVFKYKWKGENSEYLMYAGRIEKYKRIELAIRVAKKLGLKLFILGEGPHKKKLIRYARKIYPKKTYFLDFQPRTNYLELIANAKYTVNPSQREAFSIFVLESLAIGTPSYVSEIIANTINCYSVHYLQENFEGLVLLHGEQSRKLIKSWSQIVNYILKVYKQ